MPHGPHIGPRIPLQKAYTDSDGFADDEVGAEKKTDEEHEKVHKEEADHDVSKRLAKEFEKVRKAQFKDTRDHTTQAERLKRTDTVGERRTAASPLEEQTETRRLDGLQVKEAQIKALFSELQSVLEEIDGAGGLEALAAAEAQLGALDPQRRDPRAVERRLAQNVAKLLELSRKLRGAEARLRDVLRQLLSGDYGFRLMRDPSLTFRRFFAAVERWPKRIPPGHKPTPNAAWSAGDWDAFLGWLNRPPPMPTEPLLAW